MPDTLSLLPQNTASFSDTQQHFLPYIKTAEKYLMDTIHILLEHVADTEVREIIQQIIKEQFSRHDQWKSLEKAYPKNFLIDTIENESLKGLKEDTDYYFQTADLSAHQPLISLYFIQSAVMHMALLYNFAANIAFLSKAPPEVVNLLRASFSQYDDYVKKLAGLAQRAVKVPEQ